MDFTAHHWRSVVLVAPVNAAESSVELTGRVRLAGDAVMELMTGAELAGFTVQRIWAVRLGGTGFVTTSWKR